MKRLALLLLLAPVLACASDKSSDAEPNDAERPEPAQAEPAQAEPEPEPEPKPEVEPSRVPSAEEIEAGGHVAVTAEQAKAAGLAPLGFSLELGRSGMSGSRFSGGTYLSLSGPPGGPLMLYVSPATADAEFSNLVGGDRVLDATLVEQKLELLGAQRRAVAWIEGAGPARTSWCGILLAPAGAGPGDPALLLELGVGHGGDDTVCATALDHHVLGPVVRSLKLE